LEPHASIVDQLEAEGPGDWTEHEGWESSTGWAREMSADMRIAAKLAARGIEPDRIERMMDLPERQVELWWEGDRDFRRAAQASFWEERERAARPDPTKALSPKQLRAAEAYFVEAGSQKEAAEAAGVSDRTIRNWLKDPVFVYYGEHLRTERTEALAREREILERRTLGRYLAQVENAFDVLEWRLKRGDAKVALAVARPYINRLADGR